MLQSEPPECESEKYTTHRETERHARIICVRIYDDLALEAWTQSRERGGEIMAIVATR